MTKGGKKIIGNRLPNWLIDDDNNNVRATSIINCVFISCMYVINERHFYSWMRQAHRIFSSMFRKL